MVSNRQHAQIQEERQSMKPIFRSFLILLRHPRLFLYLLALPVGMLINIILRLDPLVQYKDQPAYLICLISVNFLTLVVHICFLFPLVGQALHDITISGALQPDIVKRTLIYHWYKPIILGLLLFILSFAWFVVYFILYMCEIKSLIFNILAIVFSSMAVIIVMFALPISFDLHIELKKGLKLAILIFYRYLGKLIPIFILYIFSFALPYLVRALIQSGFLLKSLNQITLDSLTLRTILVPLTTLIRLWVYTYLFDFWDTIRHKWANPL